MLPPLDVSQQPIGNYVYILATENDELCLYIGMSTRIYSRINSHRSKKWFKDVANIYLIGPYDTEDEMRDAERELIRQFLPEHSVWFNDDTVNWSTTISSESRNAGRIKRIANLMPKEDQWRLLVLLKMISPYLEYSMISPSHDANEIRERLFQPLNRGRRYLYVELTLCLMEHYHHDQSPNCVLCNILDSSFWEYKMGVKHFRECLDTALTVDNNLLDALLDRRQVSNMLIGSCLEPNQPIEQPQSDSNS